MTLSYLLSIPYRALLTAILLPIAAALWVIGLVFNHAELVMNSWGMLFVRIWRDVPGEPS